MTVPLIIGASVILSLAAAGLWDVYAILSEPEKETVSAVIRDWTYRFLPAAIFVGIILGHLFWPATQVVRGRE